MALGGRFKKLLGGRGLGGIRQRVQQRVKLPGLSGAVSNLLGVSAAVPGAAQQAETPDSVTTVCTLCGVGDSITVDTRSGTARKTKPRLTGGGRLGACKKGLDTIRRELTQEGDDAGVGIERLRRPRIREKGRWIDVPWEGALNHVAWKLLQTRAAHGRESIAFYCVGQLPIEDFWLAKKLFQGYLGTNNVGTNCEQCLVANGGGHELIFGTEGSYTRYEDLRDADVVIVIGSNPELNHPTLYNRYIARSKASVKIVVDPRRSETARSLLEQSDQNDHIAIKTGGDVLLFFSVAHLLVTRGHIDRGWVEQHVEAASRARFFEEVSQPRYAPAAVAELIATADDQVAHLQSQIERLADLWKVVDGRGLKVCTVTSVGVNQTTGSNGIAAILNCHLLTGQVGREGSGLIRLPGQANAAGALSLGLGSGLLPFRTKVGNARDRERIAKVWNVPPWFLNPVPGTTIARYPDDDRIKFIFLWGTDASRDFPKLERWLKKLDDCFVVVVDPYRNADLEPFADVMLPARPATEKSGVIVNGERRFQRINKLVEPSFEAWSDTKIMIELAARIGYLVGPGELPTTGAVSQEQVAGWVADDNRDLLALNLYHGDDFRYPRVGRGEVETSEIFDEMVRASLGMHNEFVDENGRPIDYQAIDGPDGIRWQGEHRYTEGPDYPTTWGEGRQQARFWIPAEKYRVDPLPRDSDELHLISGRGHDPNKRDKANRDIYNSGHRSGGRLLNERAHLFLHPKEARRRGFTEGDLVRVYNELATLNFPLKLSENIPRHHCWVSFQPTRDGQRLNLLTQNEWLDEQTHQPFIKRVRVRLEAIADPAAPPAETALPRPSRHEAARTTG